MLFMIKLIPVLLSVVVRENHRETAVMIKRWFSKPIRVNITAFFSLLLSKKEKSFARGWRSPDRLLLRPPLITFSMTSSSIVTQMIDILEMYVITRLHIKLTL